MALTKAHSRMIADSPVSVKDYGAVGDLSADDTSAIQNAINASEYVIIPTGDYRIDGTITIGNNKTVELHGGLIKRSADTSDTGPLIKIAGNYSVFRGNGSDSYVQSQNNSPDGVILFGAEDPATESTNYRWSQCRDVRVLGAGSASSGSKGIAIQNSQYFIGGALYECIIKNIYIFFCDTGIHLNPISNAHIIDTIHFWDIKQGIVFSGVSGGLVTDNNVSNIFVDNSPSMTSLIQLDYSTHNNFSNINGEATAGKLCDIDSTNNRITFTGSDNHAASSTFNASLSFFSVNGNTITDTFTADDILGNDTLKTVGGIFSVENSSGASDYNRLQIDPSRAAYSGAGGVSLQPIVVPGSGTSQYWTYFEDNDPGGVGTTKHNVAIEGAIAVDDFVYFNDGRVRFKNTSSVPSVSETDAVHLFATDVSSSSELRVRDEAGNTTTLSPHNFSLIPDGASEDLAWSYYSTKDVNVVETPQDDGSISVTKTVKTINVDFLKAIRLIEQLSSQTLVYTNEETVTFTKEVSEI